MNKIYMERDVYKERREIIKQIPTPENAFYPLLPKLKEFLGQNPEEHLDFLLYLSTRDQDFTESELQTKEYVDSLLEELLYVYSADKKVSKK